MNKDKKPVLTVRDLEVIYYTRGKAFRAVKSADFKVYKGETLGIVGESGSGKTTIGRTIVGINKASTGQVYLGDRLVAGREPDLIKMNKTIINKVNEIWTNVKLTQKFLVKTTQKVIQVNNLSELDGIKKIKYIKKQAIYLYNFAYDSIITINYLIEYLDGLRKYIGAINEFNQNMEEKDVNYYLEKVDELKKYAGDAKLSINEVYLSSKENLDIINSISDETDEKEFKSNILDVIAKNLIRTREGVIKFEKEKDDLLGKFEANRWLFAPEKSRISLENKFNKLLKVNNRKAEKYKIALEIIAKFDKEVMNIWDAIAVAIERKRNYIKNKKTELKEKLSDSSLSAEDKNDLIDKFNEENKNEIYSTKDKSIHKLIQMIYQDPGSSLNERMSIRDILVEGLENYPELYKNKGVYNAALKDYNSRLSDDESPIEFKDVTKKMAEDFLVNKMIERVNLLPEHLSRYPHEFSGGQRQRVGIARSLIMKPELIIADEPISALDVSIRAQVLNLLKKFREEHDLTYIFIAHDLSLMKFVADRVLVLYKGDIVEIGDALTLFENPIHPYTKALLSAIPLPNPEENFEDRVLIEYDKEKEHYDYLVDLPKMREVEKDHFAYLNDREYKTFLESKKNKKGVK